MSDNKTIGNNIKKFRINKKNWTQKDLAEASGITRESIGNYERGDRTPPSDILAKIATSLNVKVQELLYTDEELKKETEFIKNLYVKIPNLSKEENDHWNENFKNLIKDKSKEEIDKLYSEKFEKFTQRIIENAVDGLISIVKYASLEDYLSLLSDDKEVLDVLDELSTFLEYLFYKRKQNKMLPSSQLNNFNKDLT